MVRQNLITGIQPLTSVECKICINSLPTQLKVPMYRRADVPPSVGIHGSKDLYKGERV